MRRIQTNDIVAPKLDALVHVVWRFIGDDKSTAIMYCDHMFQREALAKAESATCVRCIVTTSWHARLGLLR